jgi:hypothetical protein
VNKSLPLEANDLSRRASRSLKPLAVCVSTILVYHHHHLGYSDDYIAKQEQGQAFGFHFAAQAHATWYPPLVIR